MARFPLSNGSKIRKWKCLSEDSSARVATWRQTLRPCRWPRIRVATAMWRASVLLASVVFSWAVARGDDDTTGPREAFVRTLDGRVFFVQRDGAIARVGSPELLTAFGVAPGVVELVPEDWLGPHARAPHAVLPLAHASTSVTHIADAVAFDGREAATQFPHSMGPGMRGGFSMWLWLWRGSAVRDGGASARHVFSSRPYGAAAPALFVNVQPRPSHLMFASTYEWRPSPMPGVFSSAPISFEVWTHVACVIEGYALKWFVNGVEEALFDLEPATFDVFAAPEPRFVQFGAPAATVAAALLVAHFRAWSGGGDGTAVARDCNLGEHVLPARAEPPEWAICVGLAPLLLHHVNERMVQRAHAQNDSADQLRVGVDGAAGAPDPPGDDSESELATGVVIDLDDASIARVVRGRWLVLFYSLGCVHCDLLMPEWLRAAAALRGHVPVGRVNCKNAADTCALFEVKEYPTVAAFVRGKQYVYSSHHLRTVDAFVSFALRGEGDGPGLAVPLRLRLQDATKGDAGDDNVISAALKARLPPREELFLRALLCVATPVGANASMRCGQSGAPGETVTSGGNGDNDETQQALLARRTRDVQLRDSQALLLLAVLGGAAESYVGGDDAHASRTAACLQGDVVGPSRELLATRLYEQAGGGVDAADASAISTLADSLAAASPELGVFMALATRAITGMPSSPPFAVGCTLSGKHSAAPRDAGGVSVRKLCVAVGGDRSTVYAGVESFAARPACRRSSGPRVVAPLCAPAVLYLMRAARHAINEHFTVRLVSAGPTNWQCDT